MAIYKKNSKYLKKLQRQSIQNFYLTDDFISKKIDNYRNEIGNKFNLNNKRIFKKLKILHITNFNERHNGRLFYNTGKRLNNGFIRLEHSVLEFSDRDIVSYYRNLNDLNGSKRLNRKLSETQNLLNSPDSYNDSPELDLHDLLRDQVNLSSQIELNEQEWLELNEELERSGF